MILDIPRLLKIKNREFFKIPAHEAARFLEKLSHLLPGSHFTMYNSDKIESVDNGTFLDTAIPIGAILTHVKYPNYKAKVVSKNEIEYDGKRYSLSGLSDKIMGKKCGQGKSY